MSFSKPKLELKGNFMLFNVVDKLVIEYFSNICVKVDKVDMGR